MNNQLLILKDRLFDAEARYEDALRDEVIKLIGDDDLLFTKAYQHYEEELLKDDRYITKKWRAQYDVEAIELYEYILEQDKAGEFL